VSTGGISSEPPGVSGGRLDIARIEPGTPVSVEVARRLLGYLLSGDLPLGARLPSERVLAEQFGVSRSAIRDALGPLELLGILEARPGSGTYLRATQSDLLPEVMEWGLLLGEHDMRGLVDARSSIEAGLAGLAAQRATELAVDGLRDALDRLAAAADGRAFLEADADLHMRIAEAADSPVLARLAHNVRSLLAVWIARAVETAREAAEPIEVHAALVTAIGRRDAGGASAAMGRHMALFAGVLGDAGAPPTSGCDPAR
jgi:GntR family transcriptional repressor for pyruvate dehydrogenase complex